MPSLEALAGWEDAILASLRGTTGTLEERDSQVRRSGLYAEYPAVLSGYLDHLERFRPRVAPKVIEIPTQNRRVLGVEARAAYLRVSFFDGSRRPAEARKDCVLPTGERFE